MNDYIQKFCEMGSCRELGEPVCWKGFVYATDGKIAIRVRAEKGEPNGVKKIYFIDAIDEYLKKESKKEYVPLDIELPAAIPCDSCEGKYVAPQNCEGKDVAPQQCTECDGTGKVECPTCGHDMDCEDCDGDGYESSSDETVICNKCNGTGEGVLPVEIGKTKFQRRYLALLQSLPGPVEIAIDPDPEKEALFRFSEGAGVIMPMNY
jgi:hypothetical protein